MVTLSAETKIPPVLLFATHDTVDGLGRFPVTLYREQWEKLLGIAEEIRDFIPENDGALKRSERINSVPFLAVPEAPKYPVDVLVDLE